MQYGYAVARKLYNSKLHPRVCMNAGDLDELRSKVKRGDGRKIMEALRRKVARLVRFVLEADDLPQLLEGDGSHNCPAAQIGYGIEDIAMVAALDEDADTMEAMRRLFATVCTPGCSGGRVGVSGLALPYDLLYAYLTEEERAAYRRAGCKAIEDQIRKAASGYFRRSGGNMTLGTMLSALPVVLAIAGDPGVPPLADELGFLVKCLQATLRTALNPDGYPEEDIGYGTGVTAWLGMLVEWLRRAGVVDEYRECPQLTRFGRAMLHFVQPWGEELSNTGDHGDDFGSREFILARLAKETADPTLLWLLGTLHYHHGKVHPENRLPEFYVEVPLRKGFRTPATWTSLLVLDELRGEVHPSRAGVPTQFCDRRRGIVSFRSGWGADDTFVVFDGSQRLSSAQGHAHASCGHFSLSALGEYFSIDTGRYNGEQSCHSMVLVDGRSGRSTHGDWTAMKHAGRLTCYAPGEFVDFAAVDSSHQHDCFWAFRCLGLVKGAKAPAYVWTVDDINKADDWGEYWWQLQSCPENTIRVFKDHATIRGWKHGNLLDVHFALPAPAEYPRPHALTVAQDQGVASSYKYLAGGPLPQDDPASAYAGSVGRYARPADMVHGPVYVRPRLLGKVAGLNGRFMAVMLPRRKGERAAAVRRLRSVPNSLAVGIRFGEVEDVLIFAYDHDLLEAGDVQGRGQWCVVRRRLADGAVVAHALAEGGTHLAVGDRKLVR